MAWRFRLELGPKGFTSHENYATTRPLDYPAMKVLFLDVDGVLNCLGSEGRTTDRVEGGIMGVEKEKCQLVRHILKETGAKLVISSTWRKQQTLLRHLLNRLGHQGRSAFEGCTPCLDSRLPSGLYRAATRGMEISSYLAVRPEIEHFVILDDENGMDDLLPHLIQTDYRFGLTPEIALRVIDRMKNPVVRVAGV